MKLSPTDVNAVGALTQLYIHADQPAKAIPVVEQALQAKTVDHPSMLAGLLWQAMWNAKQGEQAVKRLQQLAERFTEEHEADIRCELAYLYQLMGKDDQAEQVLTEVLQKHPDHPSANNALGYAWAEQGKNLKAPRQWSRKPWMPSPTPPLISTRSAGCTTNWGISRKRQSGCSEHRGEGGNGHPVIIDHLGDALYRLGRKDEARQYWQQVLILLRRSNTPGLVRDPELEGMQEEVQQKLEAVTANKEPNVAPLPAPPEKQAKEPHAQEQAQH